MPDPEDPEDPKDTPQVVINDADFEVLKYLDEGMSPEQISKRRGTSADAVYQAIMRIRREMGMMSRADMLEAYAQGHIVSAHERVEELIKSTVANPERARQVAAGIFQGLSLQNIAVGLGASLEQIQADYAWHLRQAGVTNRGDFIAAIRRGTYEPSA